MRYEFQGRFLFDTQAQREAGPTTTQQQFSTDVAAYIAAHPTVFQGYTPINRDGVTHDSPPQHYQLVEAQLTTRQTLDALFSALIAQAQQRGAVAPSDMWLKVVDTTGVTDGQQATAPGWVAQPLS